MKILIFALSIFGWGMVTNDLLAFDIPDNDPVVEHLRAKVGQASSSSLSPDDLNLGGSLFCGTYSAVKSRGDYYRRIRFKFEREIGAIYANTISDGERFTITGSGIAGRLSNGNILYLGKTDEEGVLYGEESTEATERNQGSMVASVIYPERLASKYIACKHFEEELPSAVSVKRGGYCSSDEDEVCSEDVTLEEAQSKVVEFADSYCHIHEAEPQALEQSCSSQRYDYRGNGWYSWGADCSAVVKCTRD